MRLPVHQKAVLEIVRAEDGLLTEDEVVRKVDGSELRQKRRAAVKELVKAGKLHYQMVVSPDNEKWTLVLPPRMPKELTRPDGHPRSAFLGTSPGRLTAAEQPCQAIRAAFQCPYYELRLAAMKVLRAAIAKGGSVAGAARVLGVDSNALFRLKRDFPNEWLEACHAGGTKLARIR